MAIVGEFTPVKVAFEGVQKAAGNVARAMPRLIMEPRVSARDAVPHTTLLPARNVWPS